MTPEPVAATRQPVHTVYGGAHLFKRTTCARLGELALRALDEYAPTSSAFAKAMGVPRKLAKTVRQRVREKLEREPVEDYRIDFEDGYGIRADAQEDTAAETAAIETAEAMAAGTLPPFFGIRIKPFTPQLKIRATRTLELYLRALTARTNGQLPQGFRVTLPKITRPKQVRTLLDALEPFPAARIEIMIETPQAVLRIAELLDAAKDRCAAAHFGPYDYTASLGITAAHQALRHPACDFARSMLQVALAGSGVPLSDGPTATLPVAPHPREQLREPLTDQQSAENREVVHRAWKLHYDNIRHALAGGFYQGLDLHPAQLPARYAAVFTFFLEDLDQASARLRNFVAQSAQATRVGDAFDDAATARGLFNFFLRALHCGAISTEEIPALTGLTLEELTGK
jgi:citrate lyase beta subunit